MSAFVYSDLPVMLAPLSSLMLLWLMVRRQSLFLRPSLVFLLAHNLMIQWPSVMLSGDIDALPRPGDWYLLNFGLPMAWLGSFVWLELSDRGRDTPMFIAARQIAEHLDRDPGTEAVFFPCWLLAVPIAALYLAFVPLDQTGLYAIVFNPGASDEIREQSFKLIVNPIVRYSFSWLNFVFAPVLLYAHILAGRDAWRSKHFAWVAIHVACGSLALLFVLLPGHRITAARILFGLVIMRWIAGGLRFRFWRLGVAGALLLFIPAIMSAQREGRDLTIDNILYCYQAIVAGRIAETPLRCSIGFFHHVQTYGLYYGDTIKAVAVVFGREPVNLPNIIGVSYFNAKVDSISATTGIIGSFYADFGLVPSAVLTSAVLVLVDSLALWLARVRPSRLALVLLPVYIGCCSAFIESAAPSTFITGGIVWTVSIGGWFHHVRIYQERARAAASSAAAKNRGNKEVFKD